MSIPLQLTIFFFTAAAILLTFIFWEKLSEKMKIFCLWICVPSFIIFVIAIGSLIEIILGIKIPIESLTYISVAFLIGAYFVDKFTKNNKFRQSKESKTNLELEGAYLRGADLQTAELQGANLRNANLQFAELQGANLHGANLENANLNDAELQCANLRGANLENAVLKGANLMGVCMRDAKGLTKEQILPAKWAYWDGQEPPQLPDELMSDPDVQEWLSKPKFQPRKN